MNKREIIDLFKLHDCPIDAEDVWTVQSAVVVKHKALERLAAALGIVWAPPQIIRAERDEAVILATGTRPDGPTEWSIGECLQTSGGTPGNYRVTGKQAPYVYAMAEKRAKDRVILKLAGLHGAYSEDEADDFKEPVREERQPPRTAPNEAFPDRAAPASKETPAQTRERIEDALTNTTSVAELQRVAAELEPEYLRLPVAMQEAISKAYAFKEKALDAFGEAA